MPTRHRKAGVRYVCPHCRETFTSLLYSCPCTEYGTEYGKVSIADDELDDHEMDDRSYSDSDTGPYDYTCPHCNGEIDECDLGSLRDGQDGFEEA